MSPTDRYLNPSEAAERLGVSAKALRLYERRGLLSPPRSEAGWRAYGPADMARAAEIAALRALGLSLAQVARALAGEAAALEPALAEHQAALEAQARGLAERVARVRALRAGLVDGRAPADGELAGLLRPAAEVRLAFDLPWPWGGERFELRDLRPLTYITGPLGSGKTRLAHCLADSLPGAAFLGLERSAGEARERLSADPELAARVAKAMAWLSEDGAVESEALLALLAGLEAEGPSALVVDMVEQGLGQPAQEALVAHLRRRGPGARPLFLLTRSSAILDPAAMGPEEAILFCPANHAPPVRVAPVPGAPFHEALLTCLASPEVRARTEGVVAWRPRAASS